jgi:hypothetical protein
MSPVPTILETAGILYRNFYLFLNFIPALLFSTNKSDDPSIRDIWERRGGTDEGLRILHTNI